MKMAKPSEKDIDAASNLMSLLGTIDRGDYPRIDDDTEDTPDFFDPDDRHHLRAFYDAIMATFKESPGYVCRVIGGMCYVIMYDKNEIVDPASDVIELHPKLVKALELAATVEQSGIPGAARQGGDTKTSDAESSPASRMGGITSKGSAETAAPGASIGDDRDFHVYAARWRNADVDTIGVAFDNLVAFLDRRAGASTEDKQ